MGFVRIRLRLATVLLFGAAVAPIQAAHALDFSTGIARLGDSFVHVQDQLSGADFVIQIGTGNYNGWPKQIHASKRVTDPTSLESETYTITAYDDKIYFIHHETRFSRSKEPLIHDMLKQVSDKYGAVDSFSHEVPGSSHFFYDPNGQIIQKGDIANKCLLGLSTTSPTYYPFCGVAVQVLVSPDNNPQLAVNSDVALVDSQAALRFLKEMDKEDEQRRNEAVKGAASNKPPL